MSDGDQIQKLVDIEAIKQLRGRYTRAIDTKDWELYGASLAEDARISTDGGVNEGRDTIVASISQALTHAKTVHHLHTPEIEVTGDTATGTWAMEDYVDFTTFVIRGYGHYTEEYVRAGDEWKIKSSTLTRLRVDTEGDLPTR
jgi:ketosteroid isomerase-like protein